MSPFSISKSERASTQDPRLSIEERYANQEAYVEAVKLASQRFVKERLLLPEDAERSIERAKADKLSQIK
jgi:hypothetical protein